MKFPIILLIALFYIPVASAGFVDVLNINITDGNLYISDSYGNDFSYYGINGTNFSQIIVLDIDEDLECDNPSGYFSCSPSLICSPNSSITCPSCPAMPTEPFDNVDKCLDIFKEQLIPEETVIMTAEDDSFLNSDNFIYLLIALVLLGISYTLRPEWFDFIKGKDNKKEIQGNDFKQMAIDEREREITTLKEKINDMETDKQKKEIEEDRLDIEKKETKNKIEGINEDIEKLKTEMAKKRREDTNKIIEGTEVKTEAKEEKTEIEISKEREKELDDKIKKAFKDIK